MKKAGSSVDDEKHAWITMGGGLVFKDLDRTGERSISERDWTIASRLMVQLIRSVLGDDRADRLTKHNEHVLRTSHDVDWSLAREYDIASREEAAREPTTDLATFNHNLLDTITRKQFREAMKDVKDDSTRQTFSAPNTATASPWRTAKSRQPSYTRPAPYDKNNRKLNTNESRYTSSLCFRCGYKGHIVRDCTATNTVTGVKCPEKVPGKFQSTLAAPSGGTYCFTFSNSNACSFEPNCINYHGCSICRATSHGASTCTYAEK